MLHSTDTTPISTAAADIDLAGDVVEVEPIAVLSIDNALRAENNAVLGLVLKCGEDAAQRGLGELTRGLHAPAREHLVGVVMMVMLMVMVMLVIMAAAGAVLVMLVLMLFVVMVMMVLMFFLFCFMMCLCKKFHLKRVLSFHNFENLLTFDGLPRSCNDCSLAI